MPFGLVAAVIAFGDAVSKGDAGAAFVGLEALLSVAKCGNAAVKQGDTILKSNVPAVVRGESVIAVRVSRHAAAQKDLFGLVGRIVGHIAGIYVLVGANIEAVQGGIDGADVNQAG